MEINNHDIDERVTRFLDEVVKGIPHHKNFISASLNSMSKHAKGELTEYVAYCCSTGLSLGDVAEAYCTIVKDTMVEQLYFARHGEFRHSKFSDVANSVYFDSNYMRRYMHGLALTSFLWPNHVEMHNFFVKSFPVEVEGRYLEIGPGHGYYFSRAARIGKFDSMVGIDISGASISMTREVLHYFAVEKVTDVHLVEADFLSWEHGGEAPAVIVMGEVLEHVEQPGLFLEKIARLCTQDTHVFLTTCVNAAAIDHIYLFRNPTEIEDLAMCFGLGVKDKMYVPHAGMKIEDCIAKAMPLNVAYVFKKL